MSPIFQNLEAFLQITGLIGRDRQNVNCLVKTGICIQIGSKLHSDGLQETDLLVLFKILSSIKIHVFHKVCQTLLTIIFKYRSGIDDQSEFYLIFRF